MTTRNEGAIHQAIAEAKQRLESLQSEVERFEKIVASLEQVRSLVNGDARPVKEVVRVKRAYAKRVPASNTISWQGAFQDALSGGVLHNRRTLALAALAKRKVGNKAAAYASVVSAIKKGTLLENAGGSVSLASGSK